MIKSIFICDCCEKEVSENLLLKIKVDIKYPKPKNGWHRLEIPYREYDICEKCYDVKNIVKRLKLDDKGD